MNSIHAKHTAENWFNKDATGYTKYTVAVNNGGKHCYNMCSLHNKYNPYDYGFKSSYKCHQ